MNLLDLFYQRKGVLNTPPPGQSQIKPWLLIALTGLTMLACQFGGSEQMGEIQSLPTFTRTPLPTLVLLSNNPITPLPVTTLGSGDGENSELPSPTPTNQPIERDAQPATNPTQSLLVNTSEQQSPTVAAPPPTTVIAIQPNNAAGNPPPTVEAVTLVSTEEVPSSPKPETAVPTSTVTATPIPTDLPTPLPTETPAATATVTPPQPH